MICGLKSKGRSWRLRPLGIFVVLPSATNSSIASIARNGKHQIGASIANG